jgi:hypothetical protein
MRADGNHNIDRRIAAGHSVDDEILQDIRAESIVKIRGETKSSPASMASGTR